MNISSSWLISFLNGEIKEPLVISTTGSSGNIKEISIPAAALLQTSKAANKFLGAKTGDTWSLLIPTNHIAGINVMTRAFLLGTETVGIEAQATFTSIVPTQLHSALNGDEKLLAHLQACKKVLVGGARTPDSLAEMARNSGINVITTYGATETCGGCVYDGIPLDGVELQIVDGLIEIKIESLNNGKWIKLNDYGEIKDGKLVVLGRNDDVIISGGENISLTRLEKLLENLFPSQNFLALGLPDVKWGQALALMSDGEIPIDIDKLISDNLGKFYLPKRKLVVKEIPKIGIGKFDRQSATKLFLSNE